MKKSNVRMRDKFNAYIDDYVEEYKDSIRYENFEHLKQKNNLRSVKRRKPKKKRKPQKSKFELKQQTDNFYRDVKSKIETNKITQAIALLCEDEITGDFSVDIIKAIFKANKLAHDKYGSTKFYKIKNKLLQYVLDNKIWGEPPYDSYGWGKDNKDKTVLYFDVPEYGQVSFHAKNVIVDKEDIPKYRYKWKEVENDEFPSFRHIDNYHDLMRFLNKETPDMLADNDEKREAIHIVNPVNSRKLKEDEEFECCFMSKNDYKKIKKYAMGRSKKNMVVQGFEMKKAKFSFEDGLIEEEDCENHEKQSQINLLKQYYSSKKER